jgi:protein transport protein SEC61 subunit gamma-like protein
MNLDNYKEAIFSFIRQSRRVLRVSKKPDRFEYTNVAKITGIGIIIIGVVGFVISIITQVLGY